MEYSDVYAKIYRRIIMLDKPFTLEKVYDYAFRLSPDELTKRDIKKLANLALEYAFDNGLVYALKEGVFATTFTKKEDLNC